MPLKKKILEQHRVPLHSRRTTANKGLMLDAEIIFLYFVPLKQMITQSRYNHQYKLFLLMRVRALVNQVGADPKPAVNFTCPLCWDRVR